MRQARSLILVLVVLALTACAQTTGGKLYQVGDVLNDLIVKATDYCESGTLNQPTCVNISIGADEAVAGWKASRNFLDEGKDAAAWDKMSGVASFILVTGANMQELGLPVPENVLGYINLIIGRE